jgi:N6-L-threonylcarbamoyladenine synthase
LALETTCDETAAAIVDENLRVLGEVVASQDRLHEKYRGVVPEIAARAHLEQIIPVIDTALRRADISLRQLSGIAVAYTPGLAGSLMIGLAAAKALAVALRLPLLGVNHLHAHIYACRIATGQPIFPCVGMIVSGGHTSIYVCHGAVEFELLGGTIDDAAGEAFDKVAHLLGLPFPGGPALSRLADEGDANRFPFPRSFIHEPDRIQFSFSGLKTAVRYTLERLRAGGPSDLPPSLARDVAASFQAAVIDCLVAKAVRAIQITGLRRLCVGGGVAANRRLRLALHAEADEAGFELIIAPPKLCTDNAVMGGIAIEKLIAGQFDDLSLDIQPGLVRA